MKIGMGAATERSGDGDLDTGVDVSAVPAYVFRRSAKFIVTNPKLSEAPMLRGVVATVLLGFTAVNPAHPGDPPTITVHEHVRHQRIDGFGLSQAFRIQSIPAVKAVLAVIAVLMGSSIPVRRKELP